MSSAGCLIDDAWNSPLKSYTEDTLSKWEELQKMNKHKMTPPWSMDQREQNLRTYSTQAPLSQTGADYIYTNPKFGQLNDNVSQLYAEIDNDDTKSSYYSPEHENQTCGSLRSTGPKDRNRNSKKYGQKYHKDPWVEYNTDRENSDNESIPNPKKIVVHKTKEKTTICCDDITDHISVCEKCRDKISKGRNTTPSQKQQSQMFSMDDIYNIKTPLYSVIIALFIYLLLDKLFSRNK